MSGKREVSESMSLKRDSIQLVSGFSGSSPRLIEVSTISIE